MQAVTDEQLIEWVAKGDSSCLGTLFERHNRGVFQYCLQVTRNRTVSEDMVQEVFLKVLRKAGSYRRSGSFKAWLFNVARNTVFDHLRHEKVRGEESDAEESTDWQLVDHRSAETAASAKEDVVLLVRAMANLPIAVQEIIWLGRFEFDSYEELGQALDCKAATARVRMHRAMQQLNAELEASKGGLVNA